MLDDYFSVLIDEDGNLTALPILIDGYEPDYRKLPTFLKELAKDVNWADEESCFYTMGKVLAEFYSLSSPSNDEERKVFAKNVECVIYPVMKQKLRPTSVQLDAFSCISEVSKLYKVFHRC